MQTVFETPFDTVYLVTVVTLIVLMIPRTCACVWTVLIEFNAMKKEDKT